MRPSPLTRRTPLGPGAKSSARGSTFAAKPPHGKVNSVLTNECPRAAQTAGGVAPNTGGSMQGQRTGRRGVERVCQECGKAFLAKSDCATRVSKYCSKECGWAAQQHAAEQATPPADELYRLHHVEGLSVEGVGRHYGKSAWWAKQALSRRDVAERSTRTGSYLTCPVCGKNFYARKSAIEKQNRRFCSSACKGKGMPAPSSSPEARRKISEAKMGAKNAAWRGEDTVGSIYRVFNVRLKGETYCRNCGAEATPVLSLHLHHAVPRSMCKAGRRDLRNGITLCHACHMGWHYRTRTIYRDLFSEEEWAFISSLELLGQNITTWLNDRYPPRPVGSVAA